MAKNLLIVPTTIDSGLTSVSLGIVRALEREGVSVGFYKPFSHSAHLGEVRHNDGKDSSVAFARALSSLAPPEPISLRRAQWFLNRGQADQLMENVMADYQKVAKTVDVVIIEGLA